MKKIKDACINILIFLGFVLLGVLIGITFGFGFVVLDNAGAFGGGKWKKLDSPFYFIHIINATTRTVWTETKENKLYTRELYCTNKSSCDQWVETKEVMLQPYEEDDLTLVNKNNCVSSGIKYPGNPKGKVVECAFAEKYFSTEAREIVYYALLSNGTIWIWDSSGPWYVGLGMFVVLVFPIIGLVLGLRMHRGFRKHQQNRIKANV